MNSLIIGSSSQVAQYMPENYIRVSSRNVDIKKIINKKYNRILETTAIKKSDLIYYSNDFSLYKTCSFDLKKSGCSSWSDATYFADLDYVLNTVYDENYFSSKNIQHAEFALKNKFDSLNTEKVLSNCAFFKRFYLVGPCAKEEYVKACQNKIEKIIKTKKNYE